MPADQHLSSEGDDLKPEGSSPLTAGSVGGPQISKAVNATQTALPRPIRQGSIGSVPTNTGIPGKVSFTQDSTESKAYREHNPPAVLRQDAARREKSPPRLPGSPLTPHTAETGPNIGSNESTAGRGVGAASSVSLSKPRDTTTAMTGGPSVAQFSVGLVAPSVSPSANATASSSTQHGKKILEKPEPEKAEELHILLAVTGSVATIKIPQIIHKLKQIYHQKASIQLVATNASRIFFDPKELPRDVKVWYDADEWQSRAARSSSSAVPTQSDFALHIELRRWADILVVAPCSANTLAKLTYGICNNLLTSVFRVWNPQVPILLAPAMNTHMYTNPVTKRHFNILREEFPFVDILRPVEKVLVCGDIGMGGMREWTDIVQTVVRRLGIPPADSETSSGEESD